MNSRRDFLKQSALLGTQLGSNKISFEQTKKEILQDAGMQFCLAYFWGMNKQRMELARQMRVLGAVGGINPAMVGLLGKAAVSTEVVKAVKEAWSKEGLELKVIEGPPSLGTLTKLGLPGRDEEIENFITLMKSLAAAGIDTICYNWMPVISWARSQTEKISRGGALVTAFDINDIKDQPKITEYGELTKEKMWDNISYFLKAVIPEAEKSGIKLALHPDDPPIDEIRGIPRIMTSVAAFKRLVEIVPSPSNGLTFCQGSFASMGDEGKGEDIPAAIRHFGKKGLIHFVHFRDVKGSKYQFEEAFHDDGKTDMYAAMQAYYETGFRGPIRPDHVPTMYSDSNEHPGYSNIGTLFAIGYIRGLMEGVSKA